MKMADIVPVGFNWRRERNWLIAVWGACLLNSFSYFNSLPRCINMLYTTRFGKRVLLEEASMPAFDQVLGRSISAFWFLSILVLLLGLYHWFYHYQSSKSIYLMRRLPQRFELLKRCITFPLIAALLFAVSAVLLTLIYFALYLLFTPDGCLPSDPWQGFFNALLWRKLI